jgi:hypothetical protein
MSSVRVAQAMTLCSCVCSALLVGLNVGESISGGVHVAGIGGHGHDGAASARASSVLVASRAESTTLASGSGGAASIPVTSESGSAPVSITTWSEEMLLHARDREASRSLVRVDHDVV